MARRASQTSNHHVAGTSTGNHGNPPGVSFNIPGNGDVAAQHSEDVDIGDDVDRAARSESIDVRYLSNLYPPKSADQFHSMTNTWTTELFKTRPSLLPLGLCLPLYLLLLLIAPHPLLLVLRRQTSLQILTRVKVSLVQGGPHQRTIQ